MKKFLVAIVMAVLPLTASAAGSKAQLDHIEVDPTNQASLQRGMQVYVNNCMGCHSLKYQRFERAAVDLGIPNELVEEHLIFGDQKVGEQMTIAMSSADAGNWFGNPPPDLSLETRLRGPDWVYTYLRSFYKDDSRPYGVNNVVFKDVGMPNVLEHLEGVKVNNCTPEEMQASHGKIDPLTGQSMNSCMTIAKKGELTPAEFDKVIYDLTNFLAYVGEPYKQDSQRIGTYTLIFLFIFFFFAFALKKEYWRDVH